MYPNSTQHNPQPDLDPTNKSLTFEDKELVFEVLVYVPAHTLYVVIHSDSSI